MASGVLRFCSLPLRSTLKRRQSGSRYRARTAHSATVWYGSSDQYRGGRPGGPEHIPTEHGQVQLDCSSSCLQLAAFDACAIQRLLGMQQQLNTEHPELSYTAVSLHQPSKPSPGRHKQASRWRREDTCPALPACIVCGRSGHFHQACVVLGVALSRKFANNHDTVGVILRFLHRRDWTEARFDSQITCLSDGPSGIIVVGDQRGSIYLLDAQTGHKILSPLRGPWHCKDNKLCSCFRRAERDSHGPNEEGEDDDDGGEEASDEEDDEYLKDDEEKKPCSSPQAMPGERAV